jgi:hypothetical protein
MHNGVYDQLEQVIDFYDKGGGAAWALHQTIKRCQLTACI